jgi:hypothetical protein
LHAADRSVAPGKDRKRLAISQKVAPVVPPGPAGFDDQQVRCVWNEVIAENGARDLSSLCSLDFEGFPTEAGARQNGLRIAFESGDEACDIRGILTASISSSKMLFCLG